MKLGDIIRDRISGFQGVLVCRSEWYNGCVRLTIQPREMKDGKRIENDTFDVEQCELVEAAAPNAFHRVRSDTGGDRQNISRSADPR